MSRSNIFSMIDCNGYAAMRKVKWGSGAMGCLSEAHSAAKLLRMAN